MAALIPSAHLAWRWRAMPQLGIYHDDGLYFVTAQSWATGHGHRIASFPGTLAQTKYPPVFPLLLSLVWRINSDFPSNLPLAALLAWWMLPLFLAAAWWWFAEAGLSRRRSLLLCAWLALNPVLVAFSLMTMSELLFAALLAATLAAAERASRVEASPRWTVLAGLLAGLAYLTRSAGLPLLFTVPLVLVIRKRWRQAVLFAVTMVPPVACWQIWKAVHLPAAQDVVTLYYTNYLKFHLLNFSWHRLPKVVWANVNELVSGIGQLMVFITVRSLVSLTLVRLAAAAAVVGAWRLMRRNGALQFPAYTAVYALILLQWDYPPTSRFIVPLAPLLLAGFTEEILHVWKLLRASFAKARTLDRGVALTAAVVVAAFLGVALHQAWYGFAEFLPSMLGQRRDFLVQMRPAYDWIKIELPRGARLLAYNDPLVYLYTGRKALSARLPPRIMYQDSEKEIERFVACIPELMREYGLQYALLTPSDFRLEAGAPARAALRKLVAADPAFHLVYHDGYASIYRMRESGTITGQ